ncbi:NAD-dependent epimerase/dehydratase family protein [Phocaeicola sp.]
MMNPIISSDVAQILSSTLIDWNRFSGKTVLITGANGMLPAYMVFTLLELNRILTAKVKVIALVRNKKKVMAKFHDFMDDTSLQLLVQDVSAPILVREDIHFIIHAASQASPLYYGVDPVGTINANVLGTISVLKLAREKNVNSFLYFSSGEVYGDVEWDKFPVQEHIYGVVDPVNVRSCYAESKRMGENLCVCWNYQYNVNAKIVRPFHTYGPGISLDDGRVFADFCRNIVNGEDIVLRSDGSARRAFCYISDAILGFFKILLDGKDAEAYNIGNPDAEVSIRELAEVLVSLYPEKRLGIRTEILKNDLTTVKMKSPLSRNTPDINKAMNLGWHPVTSIGVGFSRMIASCLVERNDEKYD